MRWGVWARRVTAWVPPLIKGCIGERKGVTRSCLLVAEGLPPRRRQGPWHPRGPGLGDRLGRMRPGGALFRVFSPALAWVPADLGPPRGRGAGSRKPAQEEPG